MKKISLLIVLIITLFVIPVKLNALDNECAGKDYACAICEYSWHDWSGNPNYSADQYLRYKIECDFCLEPTITSEVNGDELKSLNQRFISITPMLAEEDFINSTTGTYKCPDSLNVWESNDPNVQTSFVCARNSNVCNLQKVNDPKAFYGSGFSTDVVVEDSKKTPHTETLDLYQDNTNIGTVSFDCRGKIIDQYTFNINSNGLYYLDNKNKYVINKENYNCNRIKDLIVYCDTTLTCTIRELGNSGSGSISRREGYTGDVDFCEKLTGVFTIAGYVIFAIKILVPLLLIVMSMVEFIKSLTQEKDTKPLNSIKNKIIAAVAVFLVVQLTTVILEIIGSRLNWEDCAKCALSPFNDGCELAQVHQEDTTKLQKEKGYVDSQIVKTKSGKKIEVDVNTGEVTIDGARYTISVNLAMIIAQAKRTGKTIDVDGSGKITLDGVQLDIGSDGMIYQNGTAITINDIK